MLQKSTSIIFQPQKRVQESFVYFEIQKIVADNSFQFQFIKKLCDFSLVKISDKN